MVMIASTAEGWDHLDAQEQGALYQRISTWWDEHASAGEILEGSSLRFIVDSHCSNARFLPHGWIALSYGGIRVDVETKELEVAGATYYEVVSVGGITAP